MRKKSAEEKPNAFAKFFDAFSQKVTKLTGSPWAFMIAFLSIIIWAACGPLFGFSDTWQLVINTSTTIITFLMVFVIQQSQNKDSLAVQLKLNELIASTKGASNRLIDVEDLTENELEVLKKFYVKLSQLAEKETDLLCSHSIDEAAQNNEEKLSAKPHVKKKTTPAQKQ